MSDWLTRRNEDASKKTYAATGILIFDFELFIEVLFSKNVRWKFSRFPVADVRLTSAYVGHWVGC